MSLWLGEPDQDLDLCQHEVWVGAAFLYVSEEPV